MNNAHCCGADQQFDIKSAEKEYKSFLKSGPRKSTQKLIKALSEYDQKDKTLLDIGGGIGSIAWSFHENEAASTMDVDASSGYLKIAESHAQRKGWSEKSDFVFGDVTEVSTGLTDFDFVTMDKVVCCYPDYKSILKSATSKCTDIIALSFPLGGPVAHVVVFLSRIFLKLKGNPFRPYIHPVDKIEDTLKNYGFEPVHKSISFPWRIWVMRRKASTINVPSV